MLQEKEGGLSGGGEREEGVRSGDYLRCELRKVVSRQWVTCSDGCWREEAVVSEGRDSCQEGSRGKASPKEWVLGEGDPGGDGSLGRGC